MIAVSVLSHYLPNGRIPDLGSQLQEILRQVPEPILIAGDANGHHPARGSRVNSPHGNCIMQVASNSDLLILNDGSSTFIRDTTESAIDIALASTRIAPRLRWHTVEDPHGSDHSPIVIALSDKNPPETTRRPRWKYEKADWAASQVAVEDEFAKPCSMEEITSAIVQAAGQAIPQTNPNPGKRALHW